MTQTHSKYVPLFIKIAPDLTDEEISSIAVSLMNSKMDGVIATNTTLSRDAVQGLPHADEMGGLSGLPLKDKSTDVIKFLHKKSKNAFPIIGVGGVHRPDDAIEKLNAGASLVQMYTGFIYEGPGIVKRINKALLIREKT